MDEGLEENFLQKKNVLDLHLRQRRPREVLADQGILPPIKSPASFFPEVQRLERARKQDFLNHALPSRPDREVLVQRHILEDTSAAGSLVARQMDLKKAKLVDNLNDKIAFRPGVIELVERNIIPANDDLHQAIKGGHLHYKKISDYVDDDSENSEKALSPEQNLSRLSNTPILTMSSTTLAPTSTIPSSVFSSENPLIRSTSGSTIFAQSSSHPYLSRQISKGSKPGQSNISSKMISVRKKKDKPKFKKLKYHQYIPPDQLGKMDDNNLVVSTGGDTPYSRLLHQQQVYLQMQIMNKQYNGPGQRNIDNQGNLSFNQGSSTTPPPFTQTMKVQKTRNPNSPLTANRLDDMKVSELKEELKQRGLKVTGTKEVLVERLKPFCVATDSLMSDDGNSNFSIASSSRMSEANGTSSSGATNTAFPIDPNAGLSLRVARMPVPERHKVMKRELLTMPTWNHTGESMGTQTAFSPGQSGSNHGSEDKDAMLEQQRQQINALKQTLELTKAQLGHRQFFTQDNAQLATQPVSNDPLTTVAFQFPTMSHTNNAQVSTTSNHLDMSVQTQHQQQPLAMDPVSYDQSYELMNGPPLSHQSTTDSSGMDDILSNLFTEAQDVQPSPVARVLLNDHESYRGLNDPSSSLGQGGVFRQQTDYSGHKVRLRRHHQQRSGNRLSQDYGVVGSDFGGQQGPMGPDVAKMLVDTAGDALMDTSFPPIAHRYSYPVIDHHPVDHSKLSSRNSVDSGLMHSAHFSPMDTASVGSQQDILNDYRLSTSSLDSNEQMLNAISMSPVTPPRLKQHPQIVPLSHKPSPSPRYASHNLIKSASQELLTGISNPAPVHRSPGNELGYLDLTLGSAVDAPPSPGSLFDVNLANHCATQHSNPVSNRGSQDIDLTFGLGDPGLLPYPGNPNNLDIQWDSFEGMFNSDLNT